MKSLESVFVATITHLTDQEGNREPHSTPAGPLMEYLRERVPRVTVLELPLLRRQMPYPPQLTRYVDGRLVERKQLPLSIARWFQNMGQVDLSATSMRLKLRDLLVTPAYFLAERESFDLFIGVESLLALIGGVFKKAGRVRELAYYISDWSPYKFDSPLANRIYVEMDRKACLWSDYIWNYTYTIGEARREILGFDMASAGRELWVPFGFDDRGIVHRPTEEIDRNRLIYCGGLGDDYGVDLILEALAIALKSRPLLTLDILGNGEKEAELKQRCRELGLDQAVRWHGYVSDRGQILEAYLKAALSLAPFKPSKASVKQWGDVIKIRESIGCAVPVVTTRVPPSHKEVQEKGLGRVIPYEAQALAQAITELTENPESYALLRGRLLKASKENLWGKIFDRTFEAMDYRLTPIFSTVAK
ncbi:MAG: glycosyltransferase [bacterium]|nr:glycosyltransferase [bacterium]